jgi:hypothetical protein
VGAGMLALPAVCQNSGFVPSTVALSGCWVYMIATGLLVLEAGLAYPTRIVFDVTSNGDKNSYLYRVHTTSFLAPMGETVAEVCAEQRRMRRLHARGFVHVMGSGAGADAWSSSPAVTPATCACACHLLRSVLANVACMRTTYSPMLLILRPHATFVYDHPKPQTLYPKLQFLKPWTLNPGP